MNNFTNKTAFITGGASGIGLAIGKALAREGANVVLADIADSALAAAAQDFPGPLLTVKLDVRDRDNWQRAKQLTEDRFGPVHILVNNAGIINDSGDSIKKRGLVDQTPASFDLMIAINLTGVFNGIATFGAGMRDRGEGHIVNTSSSQGMITCQGVGAYCASKFGVVALSESLRQELAENGVGVSVLCPGPVGTHLTNSSRALVGQAPKDVPTNFGMTAAAVAEMTLAAIRHDNPYIFTHGEYATPTAERFERILAAYNAVPVSGTMDVSKPLPGTPEWAATAP